MTRSAELPDRTASLKPVQHCLRLLDGLAADGGARAHCLHDALSRPAGTPRDAPTQARAGYLLYRALVAIAHAVTLSRRIAADPFYRGEPGRAAGMRLRRPAVGGDRNHAPYPRRFEQIFAGRSIGQIIDHIRRDLGLTGRIGLLIDQQLAQSLRPEPLGRDAAEPHPPEPGAG